MAAYHTFTVTTNPDPVALLPLVRTACGDPAAGMGYTGGLVTVKKATDWTAPQVTATEAAIAACPAMTPQRQAQNEIDQWSIAVKALVLALIDQINVLRAGLPSPLPPITVQQALTAIRNKAATL